VRRSRQWIIFLCLCILPACGDRQLKFRWADPAPNVDGSLDDWPVGSLTDVAGKNLEYGACNNRESICFGMQVKKDSLAAGILNSGFVVFLDTEGTGSRDLELHVPAWQPGEVDPSVGGFWQVLTEGQKDSVQTRMERMRRGILCLDRKHQRTLVLADGAERGFKAGIQETRDGLTFELQIPIRIQDAVAGAGLLRDQSRIGFQIRRELPGMMRQLRDPYGDRRFFSPEGENDPFSGMRRGERSYDEGLQEIRFQVRLASPG